MLSNRLNFELADEEALKQINALLKSPNEEARVQLALSLLGIQREKLKEFYSKELLIRHIFYKFLETEVSVIRRKFDKTNPLSAKSCLACLSYAEYALKIVLQSKHVSGFKTLYSKHSVALHELGAREIFRSHESALNTSVLPTAEKKSGVEPGFIGIKKEDVLFFIYEKFNFDIYALPLPQQREKRWEYIEYYEADINKMMEAHKDSLPSYMFKLTYDEVNAHANVPAYVPGIERSSTVRRYREIPLIGDPIAAVATHLMTVAKNKTVSQLNIEAVLEPLACDHARAFGAQAQDQRLIEAQFDKGYYHFLLMGKYIKKGKELSEPNPSFNYVGLKGGIKDKYNNYLVRSVILEQAGVRYISDNTIPNLAEHLILLCMLGDRDAIGSLGNNAFRIDTPETSNFVLLDLGKSYQINLVDSEAILPNFHINHPDFKNYSILYDAPRSVIVRGLLRLAMLRGVNKPSEKVLRSYGDDFYEEVKGIEQDADLKVFEDNIRYFTKAAIRFTGSDNISKANKANYLAMATKINEVKINIRVTRSRLLDRFAMYTELEAPLVDLLENLEKMMAGPEGTTLRSPDYSTILHHLACKNEHSISWVNESTTDEYIFAAKYESNPQAIAIMRRVSKEWFSQSKIMKLEQVENTVQFRFNKNDLEKVLAAFSETEIKKKFFPADFALYENFLDEDELRQALEKMKDCNVLSEFEANPLVKDSYHLTFEPCGNTRFFYYLKKAMATTPLTLVGREEEKTYLEFHKSAIKTIIQLLYAAYAAQKREEFITAALKEFDTIDFKPLIDRHLPEKPFALTAEDDGLTFNLTIEKDLSPLFANIAKQHLTKYKTKDNRYSVSYKDLPELNTHIRNIINDYSIKANESNAMVGIIESNIDRLAGISNNVKPCKLIDRTSDYCLQLEFGIDPILFAMLNMKLSERFSMKENHYVVSYKELPDLNAVIETTITEYSECLEKIKHDANSAAQQEHFKRESIRNIFKRINDIILRDNAKLVISLNETTELFDLTLDWSKCDYVLKQILERSIKGHIKIETINQALEALNNLFVAYSEYQTVTTQRKHLFEMIQKLTANTPKRSSNLLSNILFKSKRPASIIQKKFDVFLTSTTKFSIGDLRFLKDNLELRQNELKSQANRGQYQNELLLVSNAMSCCDDLLKYARLEEDDFVMVPSLRESPRAHN